MAALDRHKRGQKLKQFNIRIPITPVPKARPRFTRFGKVYTPKKTHDFEKQIADYYTQATQGFKFEKWQALRVSIVFGMPIPKGTSKKQTELMANGTIKHIKKADIDNLIKAVLDGLNGVAWEDDSQIERLSAMKEYAKEPYVYIYIHESVD